MSSKIEKQAQIGILYHLKVALCMSELTRSGRKAVDEIIERLKNEIKNGDNNNNPAVEGG